MADRKKTRRSGAAGKARVPAKGKAAPASRRAPPGKARRPRAAAKAAAAPRRKAARPAKGARAPARGKAAAAARPAREAPATPRRARGLAARGRSNDQPDPESYFVARVRGEEAVREAPHPMTEAALDAARGAPRPAREERRGLREEDLGELPWSYGDDALVALPRDPHTLFLYWDHASATLERGWAGLSGGRPEIWIFAGLPDGGWERIRVVPFALESRGWYVHDLDPGRVYRAEIHLVDPTQDHLLPRPSRPVLLPPAGPSAVVDDRFARIAWGEHLARWLAEWRTGGPFADDLRAQMLRLSDWTRFSSGTGGGSAGGMGGRPSSPAAAPGSPSSPWGGGR